MKLEHLALNVPDPLAMGRWYVSHLGLTVKRRQVEPPYGHFLADDGGAVMVELYHNTAAHLPDYAALDPLAFHVAFVSPDVARDVDRLTAAGATLVAAPQTAPNGDTFAMLRDPWGVPLQLVRRGTPMLDV
jgi:catechol 2,3-dioxygenase-like lactoylglutathione lyase family enzyme